MFWPQKHAQPEYRASRESQSAHAPEGCPIPAPLPLSWADLEKHVLSSLSEFTREIKQAPVAYSTDQFANAGFTGCLLSPLLSLYSPIYGSWNLQSTDWPANLCLRVSLDSGLQNPEPDWLF